MTDFIAPTQRKAEADHAFAGLRKAFFVGLLGCVVLAGIFAVGVILFGEWGEFTSKVMGSLAAFAVFCGVLFRAALQAERGESRAVTFITSSLAFLALAAVLLAIWALRGDSSARALASVGVLGVGSAIGAYALRLLERRTAVVLAWATISVAVAGTLWWLYMTWSPMPAAARQMSGPDDMPWQWRLMWATLVVGGTLGITCAQVWHFAGRVPVYLRAISIAAVALTGLLLLACVFWPEAFFGPGASGVTTRVLAVAGVVTVCLFLAQTVVLRLSREKAAALTAGAPTPLVKLTCPRCEAALEIKPGEACACAGCNLQLKLEIDGALCTGCGYPLWNLPNRTCPECGKGF